MRNHYVYLNGHILPAEQAALSPFDIGVLRGYAVFDLLRTVSGRPFLLAEHLRRFRSSAEQLGLKVPASDEEIRTAVEELLGKNGHEEATVRLVLTGGESSDGMGFDPSTPTFFILTHELHEPPAALYESGGKLVTQEHERELPVAKTTNYLTMLLHRPRAIEGGALDLLYHEGGRITEAATASFYLVKDGAILAPRDRVLWGTVGSLVLEAASERRRVVYGDITLDDARGADEAFLTSTTRGVMPIVQLDDEPIGDGRVGPVTGELMAIYRSALDATR
jgi:branched-subunit amino acid aminotransferase/4-amino-4-deoxychorismate lyase